MLCGDHICAEPAKLAAECPFQIGIKRKSSSGNGRHHSHGDQRSQGAVFTDQSGFKQEAKKKLTAAQASPRSTTAGSNCMALRTAPALPRKVTSSAASITAASTTG